MATEPQTAFFSYSRDDSEFALRLAADLKAAGAAVWLDQLDIAPGQRWARAVQDALNDCHRFLIILSPSSVNSTNVEDEVAFALEEHKTVIPVLYRDCKVPFQLRPFQYVDFRTDYARGLKTLLNTLGVQQQPFAVGRAALSAVPKENQPGWLAKDRKRVLLAALTVALLLVAGFRLKPIIFHRTSPFDGTWKLDMSTVQFSLKPYVLLLQNDTYECSRYVLPIRVKADGTFQKVTGLIYFDMLSVRAIDDHNVESAMQRDGKVVFTEKDSVSADGETLTVNWTDSGQPEGGIQSGTETAKRVEKGPAGANMISGKWRTEKQDFPADVLTWTYKVGGDELTMTNPIGQSYTAKLDGTDAPYRGDPGITSVSVKMHGQNMLEVTNKLDGKVVSVSKFTVEPGGKAMKTVFEDKLNGDAVKADAQKQ